MFLTEERHYKHTLYIVQQSYDARAHVSDIPGIIVTDTQLLTGE